MDVKLNAMSPLLLAFVGDSAFELLVREHIVSKNQNNKIMDVHRKAVMFAKASSQAKIVLTMIKEGFLTEDEFNWVRKGRNQNSRAPKNAKIKDYKYATGFETMIGYLYATEQNDRISKIVERAIEIIAE